MTKMKQQEKFEKVNLYCDGASRGNPGRAAIAYIIKDGNGNLLKQKAEYIGISTNNTAEYKAIIAGLRAASTFTQNTVWVHSDSNLAINQLNNRWKINKDHLKDLYQEVKKIEKQFNKVFYTQKPRTDENLIEADQLANEALDRN